MNRRTFVKRTAVGLGVISAGGLGATWAWMVEAFGWSGAARRIPQVPGYVADRVGTYVLSVEQQIRGHFDYLDIDEDGLRAFADVHREQFGEGGNARYDSLLYERFLLSTDFFPNGADESRKVSFVRYYDPYLSPCWNPCARLGPEPA